KVKVKVKVKVRPSTLAGNLKRCKTLGLHSRSRMPTRTIHLSWEEMSMIAADAEGFQLARLVWFFKGSSAGLKVARVCAKVDIDS
ncbi:MAG: hypothetical protein NTW19_17320, partial [Planctomycetota bacterium]|nr:hypothetical protein [Planctomycetota bacterium]